MKARYRITSTTLRFLTGPGMKNNLIGRLPKGTELDLLEEPDEQRWVRVALLLREGYHAGWVHSDQLAPADELPVHEEPEPGWLQAARAELGVRDHERVEDNPAIATYRESMAAPSQGDDRLWCSAFVNWCLAHTGIAGTNSPDARSWMEWGDPLDTPKPGCIAIFKRGDDHAGCHVAFYLTSRGPFIDVLGATAGNCVKVGSYRRAALLGYRWP
jgi:uncharacterized protein (TIGR02594 family)